MSELVQDYPKIFKSRHFGVLIIDDTGAVIDFNAQASNLLGLIPNLNYQLSDIFDKDLSIDTEEISEGRWIGKSQDGIPLHCTYSIVKLASDQVSNYLLISEDYSSIYSETEPIILGESESFTSTVINSLPGQFYIFNERGEFLLWNNQLSSMSGYSHEEIKQMNALDFFPQDERALVMERIQEVLTKGESMAEAHLLTKSGRKIPQKVSGKRIPYKGQMCIIGLSTDSTELVDVQDSLNNSKKQLKSAQEIAQIGHWEWDWINNHTYWSEEMYTLCGVQKSTGPIPQIQFVSMIHRKDLEALEEERKRVVKTLTPGEAEFRFFCQSGEMKYFGVKTSPVLDSKGNFQSLEGTLQDITERKKSEEAIKGSNERYKLISKATNDAIWDWDVRTNTIKGNENYYQLFELNDSMTVDDSQYFSRIHPDDIERVKANMAEALFKRKETITEEYRFLHPDGTYRVILDRSQVVYNLQDIPVRMVGAMQDITPQKHFEEELQNLTNRLSLATTSAKLGVFDWNTSRDLLEWNEYMYEIFDVDPSDFDRKFQSWLDCLHPKDVYHFDLVNNYSLLSRRLLHTNVRVVPFSEEIKYVEIHAIILPDKNGNIDSVVGVCRDISEKVLSEQSINRAIINTQESERFEIGRELHDNAIQVLIAALMNLNHAQEKDNENSALDRSIDLTKKAINEIRRLSHQLAPSDLSNLAIDEAIKDLLKQMNSRNEYSIELNVDIEPNISIADEIRLNIYRIVQEQLSNIHKHSKARNIEIDLHITDHKLVLVTRDNGIGFTHKLHTRGIGITNMDRRVKMFEGDMEINTSPNSGCEITIRIPIDS